MDHVQEDCMHVVLPSIHCFHASLFTLLVECYMNVAQQSSRVYIERVTTCTYTLGYGGNSTVWHSKFLRLRLAIFLWPKKQY